MKRKLASIQRVVNVEPIPNADRIEKLTVLGWECVGKKGEFQAGDLCVFFEIDSILPDIPAFEFMRERKFRVKTIKLRKQVSQGLAMPVNVLFYKSKVKEGLDVTEVLGVKKHDPFAEKERNMRLNKPKHPVVKYMMRYGWFRKIYKRFYPPKTGPFPSFIPKTDEPRIQSIPWVFTKHHGKMCVITEKLDGQSATFAYYKGKTYVCSRNVHLIRDNGSNWWKIYKKYHLEKITKRKPGIAIQGEIIGPRIQGNKYKLTELKFYVFAAYDIEKRKYLSYEEMKTLNMIKVPMIMMFKIDKTMDVAKIIKMSKGNSILNSKTKQEGIVISEIKNREFSFKAINPDFLLKHDE